MSKPEDVLEKVLTGELTRQEAANLRPDMQDRLTLLSDLAVELRQMPRQTPDPDFRNRARMRLLQHIQETEHRRSWWDRLHVPIPGLAGWGGRLTACLLACGATTFGASYASASALPDDTLYPVKRVVEHVQLATALGDEAKAGAYLDMADRRAAEIAASAPDLSDDKLQSLTDDYGRSLDKVTMVVQGLATPPAPLLDKVQAHVASQATELEARAVNSAGRPSLQQKLVHAEVVAANAVDHVSLVAELRGKPGAQDVHLAQNAPAAATAAAETVRQEAGTPTAAAVAPSVATEPPVSPTAAPTKPAAVAPAASPPAPSVSVPPTVSTASVGLSLDGQFDRLWNDVAAAPFMAQKVRTQLEVDVANAKQDVHSGKTDAATVDLNAFNTQLAAAVKGNQATQYTATHLAAQANALLTALKTAH